LPLTTLSKKETSPCRIGSASFVLGAWIGNAWRVGVVSEQTGSAEAEISALIERIQHEHHSVPATG
jgi:hypothetical protein